MWQLLFAYSIVALALVRSVEASLLTSGVVSQPVLANESVIVGRSVCGGATWLLTEAGELVRVLPGAKQATSVRVRNGRGGDQPWGLACLDDGSLWTLATARALARIAPDGRLVERHELSQPWFALFAAGARLVYEPLPPATGKPVLAETRPGRLLVGKPWVGLVARRGTTDRMQDFANYVTCGIASYTILPCWFTDQSQVALSDGVNARQVAVNWMKYRAAGVDPASPIRDVALAAPARMWVLITTIGQAARREGRWLLKTTTSEPGRDDIVALDPPARLILAATDTRCILLNVRGQLVEVEAR